mmetsp:Transcript_7440/g.18836  ORF Transcript_7440/g.18836 Transcript_7440/m.18836 type:complete len:494 (-) Transcript_7440:61-1542(-)
MAVSTSDSNGTAVRMNFWLSFCMQVTFNTSGSIILLPWTFATLGYVLGPVLMVLFFAITLRAQYFLNQSALELPRGAVSTLRDLGIQVGGRRLGLLATAVQALNMLLVMPTELNVCASALQYVVNAQPGSAAHCNIICVLAMAVPAVLVTQVVRRFGGKTGRLACLSMVVICAKCSLIVYSILQHADMYPSDAAPVAGMGAAARAAGTYGWSNVLSALSNFLWILAPVFINTELAAVMEQPEQVHRQLFMSACCMSFLYLIVGLVGATTWGVSVPNPINLQLPHDWAGIAVNCLLIYGAGLDYLLSQIVCTGFVQELLDPGFDKSDFSASGCCRWLAYSMPANACALVLVCFVPELETLVGVVTATAATLGSWTIPALVGLHWGRRQELDLEKATTPCTQQATAEGAAADAEQRGADNGAVTHDVDAQVEPKIADEPHSRLVPVLEVRNRIELQQWFIALSGIVAMVALVANSAYAIATTDYSSQNFFCVVVG